MIHERIGIVGYGIVGQAVEYGFKDSKPKYYDKYKPSFTLKEVCENSDIIFVCLPTPYKNDRIDLSIVEESVNEITNYTNGTNKIIAIKSTVVPGTTQKFSKKFPKSNFAFNPEFLTEANYLEDFVNADRHVVGANDNKTSLRLAAIYKNNWPKTPMYQTDPTTAELAKYAANCLLATKVIFANEMYDLCKSLDIEWAEAKEIIVADKRIGKTHLDVTSQRGFGQKCFPKDMIALLGLFEEQNVDASVLKSVWDKNLKIRKIRDWEGIPFVKSEPNEDD